MTSTGMAVLGPTKREAATAHHEAGHAVVGFWEGASNRLMSVSIVADREAGTLGHVSRGEYPRVLDFELGDDGKVRRVYREFNPEYDDVRLVERRLRPTIVSCFAGVLAEKRFSGRGHNWAGASHDMHIAGDLITYLVGSERQIQEHWDHLWVQANVAVDLHWSEIHELAQELLNRKTMTGRETKAFLHAGTPAERRRSSE